MTRVATVLGRLLATGLVGALLVACGQGAERVDQVAGTTTTAATTNPSASTSATSTAAEATTPTAHDQLAAFLRSASDLDVELKAAAQVINGTGPPWHEITPEVAAAVSAADPDPLAAAFPAGMPPALLQKTLVVYSDLLSRRYAMRDFASTWSLSDGELFAVEHQRLLDGLANGHEAAVRFPADLADLDRAARATAPFPAESATSRAAGEVLLLERYAAMTEGGCDGHGGVIMSTVPTIEWRSSDVDGYHHDGTIAGIPFDAALVDGAWQIDIWAC